MASSESEDDNLLPSSQLVVVVGRIVPWVLEHPGAPAVGLDDAVNLTEGDGVLLLLFLGTTLGEFVCLLISSNATVGGHPLENHGRYCRSEGAEAGR